MIVYGRFARWEALLSLVHWLSLVGLCCRVWVEFAHWRVARAFFWFSSFPFSPLSRAVGESSKKTVALWWLVDWHAQSRMDWRCQCSFFVPGVRGRCTEPGWRPVALFPDGCTRQNVFTTVFLGVGGVGSGSMDWHRWSILVLECKGFPGRCKVVRLRLTDSGRCFSEGPVAPPGCSQKFPPPSPLPPSPTPPSEVVEGRSSRLAAGGRLSGRVVWPPLMRSHVTAARRAPTQELCLVPKFPLSKMRHAGSDGIPSSHSVLLLWSRSLRQHRRSAGLKCSLWCGPWRRTV